VRALVESNDIAGTGYVAGGAIFLSMYEYAGAIDQNETHCIHLDIVRRLD
jgi:hypothetical protein